MRHTSDQTASRNDARKTYRYLIERQLGLSSFSELIRPKHLWCYTGVDFDFFRYSALSIIQRMFVFALVNKDHNILTILQMDFFIHKELILPRAHFLILMKKANGGLTQYKLSIKTSRCLHIVCKKSGLL